MQFTLLTFVTLFAAVMAAPQQQGLKRQAASPNVQTAAMTNAAGEIVAFDAANVYLDSVAKGL